MQSYTSRHYRIFIAAALIVPAVLFSFTIWHDYNYQLNAGRSEAIQTAQIFQQHALNVLETHQLVAERISERLKGMSWDRIQQSTELQSYLRGIVQEYPQVQAVWLADSSGIVRNASQALPAEPVSVTDRDYFQALKQNNSGLFIGHIVKPKVVKELNFNVACRRDNNSDFFDGIIIVTVYPKYFSEFWNKVSSKQGFACALLRSDGAILSRSPKINPDRLFLPPDSHQVLAMKAADQGTYIAESVNDGAKRIYGFQKLGKYNAYILYGKDMKTVIAEWKQNVAYYGLIFGFATSLLLVLAIAANRKTAYKQAAQESQLRLAAIVESTDDAIVSKDLDGIILSWNGGAERLFNYSKEEALGKPMYMLIPPERQNEEDLVLKRLQTGDRVDNLETVWVSKDGRQIDVSVTSSPLYDSSGKVIGASKIIRNITERKRAEKELQKANDELELRVAERTGELEQALRDLKIETDDRIQAVEDLREKEAMLIQQSRQAAMGEMIGNIAHQWRQPLNILALQVQQLVMLDDYGKLTRETLSSNVTTSMELIRHMSRTIDDFRNYFRPEKEKIEFNLSEVVSSTLTLLEDSFRNEQIKIEVITQADPVITGYRNEFAQVILNILNNARDALKERNITDPKVTLTLFTEGKSAIVAIADNAGGIPVEIMDKIFDPYFTTKGPQTGTGVGLFMSKSIIEKNMGGRLTVCNTEAGAEFRIEV